MDQAIDSLISQLVNEQGSSSQDAVMEKVLQCQMETEYQIRQLEVLAANAKETPERMSCNLRVKALTILSNRLLGVSGMNTTMPTDEEVAWARKHFGLQN